MTIICTLLAGHTQIHRAFADRCRNSEHINTSA